MLVLSLKFKAEHCVISLFSTLSLSDSQKLKASSIRTPVLIQGRLERTETFVIQFKWGSM